MKMLKDFKVKGKRVLVRCDFNVPLDKSGQITDDSRIQQTLPTIEYLIKQEAKIILMSHLGDPGGKVDESLRLMPVQEKLAELLDIPITKTLDCIGKDIEKATLEMQESEILLLENLRFCKGEEENDPEFGRLLSLLGDIFINDAFGTCHRAHASITQVPKYLPSGAGLLLEQEIKAISMAMENPARPLVAIIGGVKISTKLKLIKNLLTKVDNLLLGGAIANTVLRAKGLLGQNLASEDPETIKEVAKLDLNSPRLHLPVDLVASEDKTGKGAKIILPKDAQKQDLLLDVGPETIDLFSAEIAKAKTIIWAGPVGLFEEQAFEKGTKEIGQSIIENENAFKIIGGGDTLFAAAKFGLKCFNHISSGGGAMLSFLAGEKLPGLEALEQ